jgi:hypothetical protein
MMYKWKKISMFISASSLALGSATADCIDHIAAQDDNTITRAGLAAYHDCMKTEKEVTSPRPLKLNQSSWSSACSGGTGSLTTGCFPTITGGSPNAATTLILQVTNLFALANIGLGTNYTAGSIYIRQFPTSTPHAAIATTATAALTNNTQAVCAAYDEIGWPVPTSGIANTGGPPGAASTQIMAGTTYFSSGNASAGVGAITMTASATNGAPVSALTIPLYVVCVGRNVNPAAGSTPVALGFQAGGTFGIDWG